MNHRNQLLICKKLAFISLSLIHVLVDVLVDVLVSFQLVLFLVLDEAQNTTTAQLKMFLTRLGPSAKAIITGDMTQIDLPRHQRSGLAQSLDRLSEIDGIGLVRLSAADVVRHRLVRQIIDAYSKIESDEAESRAKRKAEREKAKQEKQNE